MIKAKQRMSGERGLEICRSYGHRHHLVLRPPRIAEASESERTVRIVGAFGCRGVENMA
jgi:hypothetical protein